MDATATQVPPDRSELPGEPGAEPRWPPWYAWLAFVAGLVGTLVAVGVLAAATGTQPDDESPSFTIVATLVQSAIFVGSALLFASFTLPPRPWHFGLRRTRFWPAVGWAALGMAAFYVFTAVYSALVQPDAEQSITESLGADQGTLGLVVAGFMVIVVAPSAEEFFFRGFFFRALRTRFPLLAAAALDGLLFGVIHYDFSGADALLILPPLGVLGFVFCLVYERTGSLFPVIALHALNNAVAFGVQAEGWEVSAVLGPLMIGACAVAPLLTRGAPRPAPT
jgi:uncharacterized protein